MYVAPGSRHERHPNERSPYHMTVLARNDVGYRNLVKLVTSSHLEGFYYRPRVDRDILKQHSEGLIVMSGCASGELPILLSQGAYGRSARRRELVSRCPSTTTTSSS